LIERKQEDMYVRGGVVQVFGEMVAREWVIGRMESESVLETLVVEMLEEKVGWVLGIGKRATEVGGDELRAGDERAPCLGNAPESDERLHRQSSEDFDDHLVWEIV
jgi:hypothetical protein